MAAERVFPLSELKPYTGTNSKATIWGWIKAGLFPKPVRVGLNMVVWPESVLERWQAERAALPYESRHKAGGRPKGTTKEALAKRKAMRKGGDHAS
jgi:predicted DNA-binding transcriptional regulator AlpA